jgi:hypothetical protein
MTKEESEKHRQYVAEKTLLGVIICLRPTPQDEGTDNLEQASTETAIRII